MTTLAVTDLWREGKVVSIAIKMFEVVAVERKIVHHNSMYMYMKIMLSFFSLLGESLALN